jgi:hypothetical protein
MTYKASVLLCINLVVVELILRLIVRKAAGSRTTGGGAWCGK